MTSTGHPTFETVLRDALTLSPVEQADLIHRLAELAELTDIDDGYEDVWAAEIVARLRAVEAGDERPIEWRGVAAFLEDEGRQPSR